jgi:hypothetical protein
MKTFLHYLLNHIDNFHVGDVTKIQIIHGRYSDKIPKKSSNHIRRFFPKWIFSFKNNRSQNFYAFCFLRQ